MIKRLFAATVLLVFAGCEQESQTLPFDVSASVSSSIGQGGGTVSTPAGASVVFPSGAVASTTPVSISTVDVPNATRGSGAPASQAFKIDPVGTMLSKKAKLALRFAPTADPSRSWQASVVVENGGVVKEYGSARVDLSSGSVTASIGRLGVATAVIPSASAVFPVQSAVRASQSPTQSSAARFAPTSVSASCGSPENRCSAIQVTASQSILNQIEDAALIYPQISGSLSLSGGTVSGSIAATGSLRVKFQSGQTAESIELNAFLEATESSGYVESADQVLLTNIRHRVVGRTDDETAGAGEIRSLVISRNGSSGTVTIRRDFEVGTSGGTNEPASVSVTFPVTLNP